MKTSRNRKYFFLIILAVITVLGILWYNHESQHQEPPLLTADLSVTRIKPEDPGGSIADDYNPIYDQLKNPAQQSKSVTLLPEPEEPLNLAPANSASEDVIGNIVSNIVPAKDDANLESKPSKSLNIVTIPNDQNAKTSHIQGKKAKASYYIQLASARTKEQAIKEWERISKTQIKLLSNLGHKIESYNISGKGKFYYVLAGPLRSNAHAKLLCKKLVNSRQNCIIKYM